MIFEDEERSAAYRALTDVVADQFNLRFGKVTAVDIWDKLTELREAGKASEGQDLIPKLPGKLEIESWTTSMAIDADGNRLPDRRSLAINYIWQVDGDEIRFLAIVFNGKVSVVVFKDIDFVEGLLACGINLADRLENDLRSMFSRSSVGSV